MAATAAAVTAATATAATGSTAELRAWLNAELLDFIPHQATRGDVVSTVCLMATNKRGLLRCDNRWEASDVKRLVSHLVRRVLAQEVKRQGEQQLAQHWIYAALAEKKLHKSVLAPCAVLLERNGIASHKTLASVKHVLDVLPFTVLGTGLLAELKCMCAAPPPPDVQPVDIVMPESALAEIDLSGAEAKLKVDNA
jgi:hypothetical protein